MGDDGKGETLFPLPIVPRALSFFSPQPPHNTKRPLQRREPNIYKPGTPTETCGVGNGIDRAELFISRVKITQG